MQDFDLVIRNGRVATAADIFESDIGIKGGVVTAVGRDLPKGRSENACLA
jgi:dihydropyrimidinase